MNPEYTLMDALRASLAQRSKLRSPTRPETDERVCPTCKGNCFVGGPAYEAGEVYCTSRDCPDCNGTGCVPEKGES